MNLLLLSNSTMPDQPYLDWPKHLIKKFLKNQDKALFIPYAGVSFSYDEYEQKVAEALKGIVEIEGIHHSSNPIAQVGEAEAIIIGGGNTFHLLTQLHKLGLIEPIRKRVGEGISYIGWSAGSNVACPSVKTTNDMPIIEPPTFDALNLVSIQINPHYTEQTISGHGGESRLQRLEEYAAINEVPVLCLPEGCALKIEGDSKKLISSEPCKLIKQGGATESLHHGLIEF